MQPLKNELPSSHKVLYVFYDFETTQNIQYSYSSRSEFRMHTTAILALGELGRFPARLRAVW